MIDKTINHTINSNSNRSITSATIRKNILEIVENAENPVSTQEIGSKINRAWHSIQTHCLKLQLEGKIDGFKVGNMNLWVKSKSTG